jgi:hypothetical protein
MSLMSTKPPQALVTFFFRQGFWFRRRLAKKSPRPVAGGLHPAQTYLRTLGIEIAFGREGRAGTRVIRISALINSARCQRESMVRTGTDGLATKLPRAMLTVLTQIRSTKFRSA